MYFMAFQKYMKIFLILYDSLIKNEVNARKVLNYPQRIFFSLISKKYLLRFNFFKGLRLKRLYNYKITYMNSFKDKDVYCLSYKLSSNWPVSKLLDYFEFLLIVGANAIMVGIHVV